MTTTTITPESTPATENTTAPHSTITPEPTVAPATTAPAAFVTPENSYPPVRPTNVLGIITLVLGVLGFAIVPVITGHIALAQIKRTGDDGRGITIAGLVLGYIGLAGYVLAALIFFGALFLGAVGAIGSYR